MIIKECYIENFGALSHMKKDFDKGLNVIISENGWGKTTFSVFLRAMLFGMEGKRAKDSIREKYRPWQGGKYGGYIIFSCNEKMYRLERYFYSKESEDTFSLYDCETGKPSSDFSENIGAELFLSDKETFAKTAYIPQGRTEVLFSQSGSIISALSSEGTNSDDINYDKAAAAIDKAKSYYEKRTGGRIRELTQEYALREENISQIKREISKKEEEEKHLEEITNKLADVKNNIKIYQSAREELIKRKNAESIKEDILNIKNAISHKIEDVKKMPDKESLEKLSELYERYRNLSALEKAKRLTDDEIKLYESLKKAYKNVTTEDKKRIYELISLVGETDKPVKQSSALPYFVLAFVVALVSAVLMVKTIFAIGGIAVAVILAFWGIHKISKNKKLKNTKNNLSDELSSLAEHYIGKPIKINEAYIEFSGYFENGEKLEILDEKNKEYKSARDKMLAAYGDLENFAKEFTDKDPCKAYEYLQRVSYELSSLKDSLKKAEERLSECSFNEEFTKEYTLPSSSLEELEGEERTLSLEVLQTEKRLEVLSEKISSLSYLSEELNLIGEKLSEAREKYKILNLTAEALKAAKERMDTKYAGDIRKNFSVYAESLSAPEGARIDSGFSINVEKQGAIRQSADFSIGQRDALGLALRFSVLDALFKNEKPPVILDDPLVNLDEEKLKRAKAFIASVAEKYQVIYFTCDKNRGNFNQ